MKILFISRTYPPIIGGIEKQNYEISRWLSHTCQTTIIANTIEGKLILPFFTIYAFFKSLFSLPKYDIILLGDGVLSVMGYFLKFFSRKPIVSIVHGLDITYNNLIYQNLWIKIFIKKIDKLIGVGNETINQGVLRGIPASKFIFIPNGISVKENLPVYTKKDLENILGRSVQGSVLLTLGRMVKRNGISWFIESVIKDLDANTVYIIAGDGAEKQNIIETIERNRLQERILCLGRVTDEQKEILYCTADLFVQPNVRVDGDMEGFGLVVLEAASYGLPVIASDLEGLKDAIIDGKNGVLVQEKNKEMYTNKIKYFLEDQGTRKEFGARARKYVTNNYSWEKIAQSYYKVLRELVDSLA
jgi:phosphatidylinositol alpha-1,6-mannosyltransferase